MTLDDAASGAEGQVIEAGGHSTVYSESLVGSAAVGDLGVCFVGERSVLEMIVEQMGLVAIAVLCTSMG